jgi:hypothetical protein
MAGGDLGEGIREVGFRVDAIRCRGLPDRGHRGGTLAARMTAGEEPVASSSGYAANCIFGDVGVGFEAGVRVAEMPPPH